MNSFFLFDKGGELTFKRKRNSRVQEKLKIEVVKIGPPFLLDFWEQEEHQGNRRKTLK